MLEGSARAPRVPPAQLGDGCVPVQTSALDARADSAGADSPKRRRLTRAEPSVESGENCRTLGGPRERLLERRALLDRARATIERDRRAVHDDLARLAQLRASVDARVAELSAYPQKSGAAWCVPDVAELLEQDILCL